MTDYKEILRLASLGFSRRKIAEMTGYSRNTVSPVLNAAEEKGIRWPVAEGTTNEALRILLFGQKEKDTASGKTLPDFDYTRKELQKNGVTRTLLWTEYVAECRAKGGSPLMYSQYCKVLNDHEDQRRATMHIGREPGQMVEVDWCGDKAHYTEPETGEIIDACVFVSAMTYSKYAYVEAFDDEKEKAWITAHNHMYRFFGGVPPMLVNDNCKTAVIDLSDWASPGLQQNYMELGRHYNTAIVPARPYSPDDKPGAENSVKVISTWIIAALRNEQFFSLGDLNIAIQRKLDEHNTKNFQGKDFSRRDLYIEEELPLLAPLPATPYEIAEWRKATVQYNYHISVYKMFYSVPYIYLHKKVDVRITESVVEIFLNENRIASHKRLTGRAGQYSTSFAHMPEDHQKYLEWDGSRFRKWAAGIGVSTEKVIDSILKKGKVEQQNYRSCLGVLKLADKYSRKKLEAVCEKALQYTTQPSYKIIKNLIAAPMQEQDPKQAVPDPRAKYAITRKHDYYGGDDDNRRNN